MAPADGKNALACASVTDPSPTAADPQLYTRLAAAYVRGRLARERETMGAPALLGKPLVTLDEAGLNELIRLGNERELRLHRFKRSMGLPRVLRVLGILRGIGPTHLLDVGSGRGAFLWPLLDSFPRLAVTAVDPLRYRAAGIQAVHDGGVSWLTAVLGDVTSLSFADDAFDVITLLEVLEHVPDTRSALAEVCRVARRFVVLSVPSKPDHNPGHIHLFSAATLELLLLAAGAARVTFDYVPGHIIAVAKVGGR
jgi:ubiquinone/menaquinone biosynthesis C-methylase UbiE